MTEPLTPARLDEIRARAEINARFLVNVSAASITTGEDVPALLAEVERLTEEVAALREDAAHWRRFVAQCERGRAQIAAGEYVTGDEFVRELREKAAGVESAKRHAAIAEERAACAAILDARAQYLWDHGDEYDVLIVNELRAAAEGIRARGCEVAAPLCPWESTLATTCPKHGGTLSQCPTARRGGAAALPATEADPCPPSNG